MNSNTLKKYYDSKALEHDEYHLTYGSKSLLKRGFYLARFRHVLEALNPQKNERILDIGCGIGYYAQQIAKKGAKVYATDISENYVQQAKKRTGEVVSYKVSDAIKLPFRSRYFDKVLMTEVIEHVPHFNKAITEAARVLNKNGYFIITTPNKYSHMNYAYNLKRWIKKYSFNEHLHEFTKRDMESHLEKYFTVEKVVFSNYLIPYPFDQLLIHTSSKKIVFLILSLDTFLENVSIIRLLGWTMIFTCKKK